jgi:hypothetical protein
VVRSIITLREAGGGALAQAARASAIASGARRKEIVAVMGLSFFWSEKSAVD